MAIVIMRINKEHNEKIDKHESGRTCGKRVFEEGMDEI